MSQSYFLLTKTTCQELISSVTSRISRTSGKEQTTKRTRMKKKRTNTKRKMTRRKRKALRTTTCLAVSNKATYPRDSL